MLRAPQPAAQQRQLADPSGQVKVPPPGIDRAPVVPVPGAVRARRADQDLTSQTQPQSDRSVAGQTVRMHAGDGHAFQVKDTVE